MTFGWASGAGNGLLIYPALRSALFAVVFIVFDIIEKMLLGVLHGKSLADSIESFGGGGLLGGILVAIIVALSLVPFFGFVEVSRLMEPGELARIFFLVDPRPPTRISLRGNYLPSSRTRSLDSSSCLLDRKVRATGRLRWQSGRL